MSGSHRTAEGGSPPLDEELLADLEARLRQRELQRDQVYDRARRLRRAAQTLMVRLHAGTARPEEAAALRQELAAFGGELRDELRAESPLALDALQEGVEALLLEAVHRDTRLPGPAELGIPPEPYLLGLGDLVGEVRRLALRALAEGHVDRAEERLGLMEALYHALMRFDAPRGIVALKPKQDTARSLLERTRGDVTMARVLLRAHLAPPPAEGPR